MVWFVQRRSTETPDRQACSFSGCCPHRCHGPTPRLGALPTLWERASRFNPLSALRTQSLPLAATSSCVARTRSSARSNVFINLVLFFGAPSRGLPLSVCVASSSHIHQVLSADELPPASCSASERNSSSSTMIRRASASSSGCPRKAAAVASTAKCCIARYSGASREVDVESRVRRRVVQPRRLSCTRRTCEAVKRGSNAARTRV
mmetsp:Transcript_13575/g.23708  ORF Transcript_13575/g.23708 Transcript_13575/m.23708 type:complete len:206 (-) Transcript_13575:435-1052(-)